jgi:geranylgeranyl reductase family protein
VSSTRKIGDPGHETIDRSAVDVGSAAVRVADVVIVGGGPAGCAAAITLARAGRDVVVLDKARFPRDKFCGDGLTTGALRLLDRLGLDPKQVPSWRVVEDVVLRTPSGREVTFPLPRTGGQFAAVARRVDLDQAMVELAREAGARVLDGHACTAATPRPDRMIVEADGVGPIQARYVIGADGMWSPLRKMLRVGVANYLGEWHAFRQYFRDVGPVAARDLYVSFEPDFLPGYFWSFPVGDGRANVGFGIRRDGGLTVRAMKALWPEILARPHIAARLGPEAKPESPHRAWPIPARVDRVILTAGRALFVGDAAAATDPMTGEGIGQALASGIWAAEAMLAAGPDDADRAVVYYRRAVHAGLVRDHRLADVLSRAMGTASGVRAAVWAAGSTDWTRRNFARWLFEDYPRALLATPSRWRPGMFTGPGAYD